MVSIINKTVTKEGTLQIRNNVTTARHKNNLDSFGKFWRNQEVYETAR